MALLSVSRSVDSLRARPGTQLLSSAARPALYSTSRSSTSRLGCMLTTRLHASSVAALSELQPSALRPRWPRAAGPPRGPCCQPLVSDLASAAAAAGASACDAPLQRVGRTTTPSRQTDKPLATFRRLLAYASQPDATAADVRQQPQQPAAPAQQPDVGVITNPNSGPATPIDPLLLAALTDVPAAVSALRRQQEEQQGQLLQLVLILRQQQERQEQERQQQQSVVQQLLMLQEKQQEQQLLAVSAVSSGRRGETGDIVAEVVAAMSTARRMEKLEANLEEWKGSQASWKKRAEDAEYTVVVCVVLVFSLLFWILYLSFHH